MKIKLLFAPSTEKFRKLCHAVPFLGIPMIAGYLRQKGYAVDQDDLDAKCWYDNIHGDISDRIELRLFSDHDRICAHLTGAASDPHLEEIGRKLLEKTDCAGCRVTGISVHNEFQILPALLLCKTSKEEKRSTTIMGGAFISLFGRELMEQYPFIDYIIVGEGENSLAALLDTLNRKGKIEDVAGLIYRKRGKICENLRAPLSRLTCSAPDFDGLPLSIYKSYDDAHDLILPYIFTRGCHSSRCTFCENYKITMGVLSRPPDDAVAELEGLSRKYGAACFVFNDNAINGDYHYADRLCDALIGSNPNILWTSRARMSNLDRSLLQKMRKAGCLQLRFGFEMASHALLQGMRKGITVEDSENILRWSHEAGILTHLFFMAGYIGETAEDIHDTVRFIRKNAGFIDSAYVNVFRLTRHSPIFANQGEFGIENIRFQRWGKETYAFDEKPDIAWEEKSVSQEKSRRTILQALEDEGCLDQNLSEDPYYVFRKFGRSRAIPLPKE